MNKSNKNLHFIKDRDKSYVWVKDGLNDVGLFAWHYKKKKWIYEEIKQEAKQ